MRPRRRASPAASTSSSRQESFACSRAARSASTPFLDIRPLVLSGGEQGLLSVAFDPAYATTHRFFVDYTDRNGDTHVVEYRSNGTRAIPSSAKQRLFVKDFASNHNGGQLQFGPDGRLYWGNGDGGGGGDPESNGQSLARPFAKIMRLNINAKNPRWTLVAYGLRNPWRFSFDRKNGDLYIGDVGQDAWEEIDYLKRGTQTIANFGWNRYEGTHVYDAVTKLLTRGVYHTPVAEYPHERRLLRHRRLRLSRHEDPVRGRPLLLRRLLLRPGVELEDRRRPRDGRAARAVHGRRAVVVRHRDPTASCTSCPSSPATSSASPSEADRARRGARGCGRRRRARRLPRRKAPAGHDWARFGYDTARHNASPDATITAANVSPAPSPARQGRRHGRLVADLRVRKACAGATRSSSRRRTGERRHSTRAPGASSGGSRPPRTRTLQAPRRSRTRRPRSRPTAPRCTPPHPTGASGSCGCPTGTSSGQQRSPSTRRTRRSPRR